MESPAKAPAKETQEMQGKGARAPDVGWIKTQILQGLVDDLSQQKKKREKEERQKEEAKKSRKQKKIPMDVCDLGWKLSKGAAIEQECKDAALRVEVIDGVINNTIQDWDRIGILPQKIYLTAAQDAVKVGLLIKPQD